MNKQLQDYYTNLQKLKEHEFEARRKCGILQGKLQQEMFRLSIYCDKNGCHEVLDGVEQANP
jgi:hypothetical protein